MNQLFLALLAIFSFTSLQAHKQPPCNHESIEEALNNDNGSDKEVHHHHHHNG